MEKLKINKSKFSFLIIGILGLISCNSCNKKENVSEEIDETKIEIPFTKEGELVLKNNGTEIKKLDIEVTDDESESQQGLMNRSIMPENNGMLFPFEDSKIQTFWMHNTRMSLDLIYINKDSLVVDISKNAPRMSDKTIPSDTPSQYVLEVNAGMADKWGVKENETKVSWKRTN